MAKTARLELRVEPDFLDRVKAEADRRGQKVATFVERAVERELSGGEHPLGLTGVGLSDAAARLTVSPRPSVSHRAKRDVTPRPKGKK